MFRQKKVLGDVELEFAGTVALPLARHSLILHARIARERALPRRDTLFSECEFYRYGQTSGSAAGGAANVGSCAVAVAINVPGCIVPPFSESAAVLEPGASSNFQ